MIRVKVTGISQSFDYRNSLTAAPVPVGEQEEPPRQRWAVGLMIEDGSPDNGPRDGFSIRFDTLAEAMKYELGKVYDLRLTPSER